MNEERVDFTTEFPEGATPNIDLPEGAEVPAATERETYPLNDGSVGSRAAFIREKFLQDNMSRKAISEEFGFPYRVVYSATVNMTNTAEAPARGRTATTSTIKVTADGRVVIRKDDGVYCNGEKVEDVESLGELMEIGRNAWIKQSVDAGISRGEIAKWLDMSYGVIYSITKDQEGTRQRAEITGEDGNPVSRAEYIRSQYAAGKSRGDIAKELGVPYNIVWQATRTTKTESEQFHALVEHIKSFKDKVENTELFDQICDALDTVVIKEAAPDAEAEAPAESAEA